MFGLFGKKKQETLMDDLIKSLYGDHPKPKTAKLSEAIELARDLLMGQVSDKEIAIVGAQLDNGPMPYSTHDLAVSIALNFFKNPQYIPKLYRAQLMARITVLGWLQETKVLPMLVSVFEDTLYKLYK